MTGRTLVAGVGNVFLSDDAFGVEVVRLLADQPCPPGVEIRDFGIRGVHLVYELLDGCDLFVLVDAAPRGEEPGTVTVLEVGPAEPSTPEAQPEAIIDAHSLTPDSIFALLSSLGGQVGRSLVVACEPADVSAGMGLSAPVREALPQAVQAVRDILARTAGAAPGDRPADGYQADGHDAKADLATHDSSREHDGLTREGGARMLTKLITAALVVAVLALVIDSLPDIKRYLELRDM